VKTALDIIPVEIARPFVKWAGGKGQLLDTFKKYYPAKLIDGCVKKYIEPFVGGGAVLFDILQNYSIIDEAYIFDINSDLINAYKVIKDYVDDLIEKLIAMEEKYLKADVEVRKKMYYDMRELYNKGNCAKIDINRAAQFIFLNRTCFNGLFRVNKSGYFNVPMGDYKNPTICDKENLYAVNNLLQRVNIMVGDYRESLQYIDKNSFVYFDPPYRPLNITSSFTSYSKFDFTDEDQICLAQFFSEANLTGALLMLSNSDPKNVNPDDNFFDKLYEKFYIHRIYAKRAINSKSEGRGNISEILVTNYKVK